MFAEDILLTGAGTMGLLLQLLNRAGAIDTAPLLGPSLSLAELPGALASVRGGEGIKV